MQEFRTICIICRQKRVDGELTPRLRKYLCYLNCQPVMLWFSSKLHRNRRGQISNRVAAGARRLKRHQVQLGFEDADGKFGTSKNTLHGVSDAALRRIKRRKKCGSVRNLA